MTETTLAARVRERLESSPEDRARGFLGLRTLDSGALLGIDGEGRFTIAPTDAALATFSEATALTFCEVLEGKRDDFEESLEKAATEAGLPGADVLEAFPALPLIRAVLAKNFGYMTRLALAWLRPSELREARTSILAVIEAPSIPVPVKELARRLVVPVDPEG